MKINGTMALYDLTQLKEISGGDNDFIESILDTFRTDMPQMLSYLQKAYRENDLEEVGKKAHKMKSSIDFMGIDRIKQTIRDVERQGKESIDESLASDIQKIEEVIQEVLKELSV